jgi:hypothetical protein
MHLVILVLESVHIKHCQSQLDVSKPAAVHYKAVAHPSHMLPQMLFASAAMRLSHSHSQ